MVQLHADASRFVICVGGPDLLPSLFKTCLKRVGFAGLLQLRSCLGEAVKLFRYLVGGG